MINILTLRQNGSCDTCGFPKNGFVWRFCMAFKILVRNTMIGYLNHNVVVNLSEIMMNWFKISKIGSP